MVILVKYCLSLLVLVISPFLSSIPSSQVTFRLVNACIDLYSHNQIITPFVTLIITSVTPFSAKCRTFAKMCQ